MPWYYGWNVLAVGMVFQAITFGIGIYCFTFWVVPWTTEFRVGRGEVMTVFLALQVAMGLLAPFAGRAMDALSIRALVIAGALCFALALILAAQATALWQIAVLYGSLVTVGMVIAGPLAAQTLAAKWFTSRRGLAIGISTIGTSLGGFLIPPLVTGLQGELGWREANIVLAGVVLLGIVPATWLIVRNSPEEFGLDGDRPVDPTTPTTPKSSKSAAGYIYPDWTTRSILQTRVFWVTVVAFTPMAIAFGAAQQNLAPYTADHGIDTQATSYLVSLMALVMIAAKVFFGAMADRWSHRNLYLIALTSLLIALGLMGGTVSYRLLVAICVLLGFAAGAFLPMLGAIVGTWFGPAAFGRVMGLIGPFTTLAAAGPWLAGHIRDTSGSYDGAWLTLMVVLVPAAIAALLLTGKPDYGKHD